MIILLQSLAVEGLALAVAAATVCRLGKLNVREHKPLWIAIYFGVFCGAVTAMYEAWTDGPSWSALLLLAAVALFLWGSRHTWRERAPHHLER